jgi:PST family polysaccharide transporter
MSVSTQAVVSIDPMPADARAGRHRHSSVQILRSSAVIGGASAINIVVGVLRAKVMAVLLGPASVGVAGLYLSVVDLTVSVAGMGINGSGVRQIAEAVGSGDEERITRTATALRRTAVWLAVLGGVLLAALCRPVARWTFGSEAMAIPVAVLSLAVAARALADAYRIVLQGTRRIGDLARADLLSAVAGTAATVVLIFAFREHGVLPAIVAGAVIGLISAFYFGRHVAPSRPITFAETRREAIALVALGSAFMASAVLTAAGAYAIRALIATRLGIEAAGLYGSAWTLGGIYVGFILQAMGTDFFPRLTGVAHDAGECNRLVNEQAQVSLLLAGPGVLGTLTLAPIIVSIFYDTTFAGAVVPLRWICVGMSLRVIAWPMGCIILARNAKSTFFWTEVAATAVHVGAAWWLSRTLGLTGAAMAFAVLYVWHGFVVFMLVRRMTGFGWTPENRRLGTQFLALTGAVFAGFSLLPFWAAFILGLAATTASGLFSLRRICDLVPPEQMPAPVRRLLVRLRMTPRPE